MTGYPITLVDLANTRCLVIGGGKVAARKVADLVQAGARPVVISPALCERLRRQVEDGEIDVILRHYQPGDLVGVRLVIAATDEPATNEAVWREGQDTGCLVNIVDDPSRCNFHVPATVRRGELTLAVSTGGSSPLLARRIREMLEQQFDMAYEPYLELLGELRLRVRDQVVEPARRRALWESLLDSEVLDLLRTGQTQAARQRAESILDTFR